MPRFSAPFLFTAFPVVGVPAGVEESWKIRMVRAVGFPGRHGLPLLCGVGVVPGFVPPFRVAWVCSRVAWFGGVVV